jgi:hypothetical protein
MLDAFNDSEGDKHSLRGDFNALPIAEGQV